MKILSIICVVVSLTAISAFAQETYPTKTIHLVIPWGAGGTTDILGRAIAEDLRIELKQPVVVENQAGASGIIGANRVSKAAADGYTLLFTTNVQVINPAIRKAIPFDAIKDFTSISLIGSTANTLIVKFDSPYKNYNDYVLAAKKDPGGMTYATPGMGTSTQFAAEQFGQLTNSQYTNIPYNSTTAMAQSVIAGDVKSTWLSGQAVSPFVKSNQLRVLGVASEKRSFFLPDVPTFKELGLNGFVSESWWGLFAPANLPQNISDKLISVSMAILGKSNVQDKLKQIGLDRSQPIYGNEFKNFMIKEIDSYRSIVHSANIKLID